MGGNAHIACRVLRGMADSAPGRAALRCGSMPFASCLNITVEKSSALSTQLKSRLLQ
jgi:hypothetical protein